ncbi:MAG: phage holin family protein [Bacteroidetes bacterium]|nr:phage holin family protein [Bacteroidota bacterium]
MNDEKKIEYDELWEKWLPRIKEYTNNRIELLKLSMVEAVAKATASAVSNLMLFTVFSAFFVFASFALALYLGVILGAYYLGFAVMAAFYLLLFLLIMAIRKNQIEKPILNQTIKKLMEEHIDEN